MIDGSADGHQLPVSMANMAILVALLGVYARIYNPRPELLLRSGLRFLPAC